MSRLIYNTRVLEGTGKGYGRREWIQMGWDDQAAAHASQVRGKGEERGRKEKKRGAVASGGISSKTSAAFKE